MENKKNFKETTDTHGLMEHLDCGRKTAIAIGTAAGARVQVGRRVLWVIPKVDEYLETVSGV